MNREISLTKRVRIKKGLRYCPVVLASDGRVKPDYVLVNGQQERHPEGSYYISRRFTLM
jgi:integrase/recombinase XerD